MTNEELIAKYDLKAMIDEAGAFRVVNIKTGAKCRTFDEARANDKTLYRADDTYCAQRMWQSPIQERGDVGLKILVEKICRGTDRDVTLGEIEQAQAIVKRALRPCQHPEDEEIVWHLDAAGEITRERCNDEACQERNDSPKHFVEVTEYHHERAYEVPPETSTPGWYSLKRQNVCYICGAPSDGVMSLTEQLHHAAGGPHPERLLSDGWHTSDGKLINDLKEPLFVVRSIEEGQALSIRLDLINRWREGKLSRWYISNAFYVVDAPTREALLDTNLTKATVTGALSWKPVVMTFTDADVERKLAQVCESVVTVLPVEGRDYLADVRSVKEVKKAAIVTSDDVPAECLDGWLGEVCRTRLKEYPLAYSWPALLTAASVLVTKDMLPEGVRANLFTGLIGPVGSGKTCCFNEAFRLLNLKDKPMAEVADTEVVRLKSGSGEGMTERIGDQQGAPKILFVDELEHLLKKVNIKGAAFQNTLDDAYTTDALQATVEHRKHIAMNVRLSLAGGIPEEGFSEAFGAGTIGGLHSRFTFGVCPSDYPGYCWIPPQGRPALEREEADEPVEFSTRPTRVNIDASVWTEKVRWQRELKLHGRAIEIALKAAVICAAFDNRGTLTAEQLGPALAFARYQDAVHRRFMPNPGKNDDACFESDVTKYLNDRASHGDWVNRRQMLKDINAHRYGSGVSNRVLAAMSQNRIVELDKVGRELVIRLVLDKR